MQLNEKIWIIPQTLYELAKIIQADYPNNNINWTDTFFIVEKSLYINNLSKTQKPISDKLFDQILHEIDLGRNIDKETEVEISKDVAEKLSEFGLI